MWRETLMNKSQLVSLLHFLHDFPDDMGYQAILDLITTEDETPAQNKTVIPCGMYEDLWTEDLIIQIEKLQQLLQFNYGE